MLILSLLLAILFGFLAYKNFHLAFGIFIISLPTYLTRFDIGPLPTTLLEVFFGALFLVWLIKYAYTDWPVIIAEAKKRKWFTVFFLVFLVSSIIGIYVSDMWYASLGQWRAYFLEPMLVFVMLVGRCCEHLPSPLLKEEGKLASPLPLSEGEHRRGCCLTSKDLIWFLALSTISISVLAIIQKLTGQLYPPSLWDDELNGRVVAFFTTPNAVGLYLAPVVMLAFSFVIPTEPGRRAEESFTILWKKIPRLHFVALGMTTLFAVLAIIFSFSQGAWIALGAGIVAMVFFLGYKKTAVVAVFAGIIVALAIPQIRSAVLFQDKAGQNRLTLWHHSMTFLTASPKNFIFGAGIRQYFRKVEKLYYNPVEMERLIYPHNIFLNFWTETGLLGMASFIGILAYSLYLAFKIKNRDKMLGSALIATLVVFVVHGLVDVPYFKNDLAMLFWIIIATIFSSANHSSDQTLRL